MDAKKNATDMDDEDIIDLTDIIEKGVARAPKADELDSQLSDLSDPVSEKTAPSINLDMDADIDALLAQMSDSAADDSPGSLPDPAAPGTPSAPLTDQDGHVVNPDETLDMPGMTEVDSLLQELDMPPQPEEPSATAPSVEPSSPTAEELDSLLDGLLDGPAAPAAAPAPAPPPPVADVDDLDALLAGDAPAPEAAVAVATVPPIAMDDLDALLQDNATAAADAAPPQENTDAPHTLDALDDLDALLQSDAAAPAPPVAAKTAPAPAPATPATPATEDDLDALLRGAAAEGAPSGSDSTLDDLDALLGMGTPAEAAPAPHASPEFAPNTEDTGTPQPHARAPQEVSLDDLEALLGTDSSDSPDASAAFDAPVAVQPVPVPEALDVTALDSLLDHKNMAAAQAEEYVPDVAELDNLDALLAVAPLPAPEPTQDTLDMLKNFDSTPLPPPASPKQVPTLEEDLMALDAQLDTGGLDAAPLPEAPAEPAATLDAAPGPEDNDLLHDIDSLLGLEPDPASGGTPEASAQALPGQQQDSPEAEQNASWRDPLPGIPSDVPPENAAAEATDEDSISNVDPQELQRAVQALMDEKVMLEATTGEVNAGAWLDSLDEALAEEAVTSANAALDDVLAGGTPPEESAGNDAAGEFSALEAPADAAPAAPVSMDPDLATLPLATAATLGATAAAMAASSPARANVALEPAPLADEDRARVNELEERLMTLEEQWQVREATQRQMLEHMSTQDLHHSERLSALEARLGSVQAETQAENNARLDQLESRVDSLDATLASAGPLSAEDEELRAARLDLMEGRLMVLEDAEEKRSEAQDATSAACPAAPVPSALDTQPEALLHALEERITALENQSTQAQLELEERLTTLENQCRQMENFMQERLESAAAVAAAKIIREEIAALLTSEA